MVVHDLKGLLFNRYGENTLKRFFNITSPWVEIHFSYITFNDDTACFQLEVGNTSGVRRIELPTCIKGTVEERIAMIVDWVGHRHAWNSADVWQAMCAEQINAQRLSIKDERAVVVLEDYANSKFVRTSVTAEIITTFPRGPAFAPDTFTEKAIGAIINDPEIKFLNDHLQSKMPVRSWIRVNKLETMIITRLEYVYELSETMFMTVTVDHARPLLPKAELIALFSRTNIKGTY